PARAALRAGDQDHTAKTLGAAQPSCRVRDAGGGRAGAGNLRLADPYGVYRAHEPIDSPACGGGGTAGEHAVQRRGQSTTTAGIVPRLLQFLSASRQFTPA